MPAGTMLDVLGVLDSIGDFTTITLKNGTEQSKRSIVLRDNSNRSIELTMWAEFASEPGDQLSQVSLAQLKHAASVDCIAMLRIDSSGNFRLALHVTSSSRARLQLGAYDGLYPAHLCIAAT